MTRRIRSRAVILALLIGLAAGGSAVFAMFRIEGYPVSFLPAPAPLRKFYAVFQDIHSGYFRKVPANQLLDGAISGMTNVLNDPFTDYFNPQQAKQFQNMLSSSMVGIGVSIVSQNGYPTVVQVFPKSPAAKSGVQTGDEILTANGTSLKGLTLDKASQHIEGPKGSVTVLRLKRGKDTVTARMKLEEFEKPSVMSRMLKNHIGYLQITVMANKTASQANQQLNRLKRQGATSVILDLRGNPGGYLNQAVQTAGLFLPKKAIVVETESRSGKKKVYRSPGPGGKLPVVVLMNQDTASAAEILAASLHEDKKIPLLGTRSYGKGTAQITDTFSDGSELKYTVEKWLTPDGDWINKKGLTPQESVKLKSGVNLGDPNSDNQLQAAILWLRKH